MAGFSGANKIDMFAFFPAQSFGMALTTYVGQNIGAGKDAPADRQDCARQW